MWLSAPLRTTRAMVSAQNCEPGSSSMPRRQSYSSCRILFTLSDCVWLRISMSYQSRVKSSSGIGDHTTPAVQEVLVSGSNVMSPLRSRWKPSFEKSRSEEHTSELQSLMRISYAVLCLKNNNTHLHTRHHYTS